MALGGGTFTSQNKVLPGTYINFISKATAVSALTDRGVVAFGFDMDWGDDTGIIEVTSDDLVKRSLAIFGYSYDADEMKPIRDIFKHSIKLYAYRLNKGGAKATCIYATAKYAGTRGNDIKIVIEKNVDDTTKFDISTYFGASLVDKQSCVTEPADNDYVVFSSTELSETAGVSLEGGTNGTSDTASHQSFLDAAESYSDINAIGYAGDSETIKMLYIAWAKRVRDEIGIKLQAVVYNKAADYEGVVNVKNNADVVYWVTGVVAGTGVNASATNMAYDGEAEVSTAYTQRQLEQAIESGEFTLHKVGTDIRVLEDINSLVTVTETKGSIFKDNQTIRIVDNIATSTASLFNTKYLGKVPNDVDGRLSLWNDIKKIHSELQDMRAIQDFADEDLDVSQGDGKKTVVISDAVTIINTMEKLYMTVVVA